MKETFTKNNELIEEDNVKDIGRRNNLIYEVNRKSMPMIPLTDFESLSHVFENHNNFNGKGKRETDTSESLYLGQKEEIPDDNQLPLTTFFPEDIEGSATIEPRFKKIILSPNCGLTC
ncbi:Hypothetical protein SRAE_1000284200 [Strongyloides ratti]|uniref:Uncharacterized protein n=1 Tax=Strongyloides ratti TaxID=34506 RepID=A0A090MX04_STRRB|nr:Hypothetical protein SRAE_1000284200 [Strongyloides ratti]CEF64589.1 Hypothetical protein SRAE_1000284200 [Strongyloides ratti]